MDKLAAATLLDFFARTRKIWISGNVKVEKSEDHIIYEPRFFLLFAFYRKAKSSRTAIITRLYNRYLSIPISLMNFHLQGRH